MAEGELVPLVMLPRFSTYSGQTSFVTVAMDVTEYQNAILNVWRGPVTNAGTFKIFFEESTDQVTWSTCAGTSGTGEDPGDNTELQYTAQLKKRWFRVKITIGASADASVTCWAVGFLEQRLS